MINKNIVLDQFKNIDEYKTFLKDNAPYMRSKKELERYLIEEE